MQVSDRRQNWPLISERDRTGILPPILRLIKLVALHVSS